FSVLIFIFADVIAQLIAIPEASLAFRVMSPALMFCGITATLRGFFQGRMNMLPSALSQVSDSFGRFFAGIIMAFAFSSFPLSIRSAGAISGVPFGALLSALILIVAAIKSDIKFNFGFSVDVLKKLLFLSIPITLTSSMHAVFNMLDTVSVVPFLSYMGVAEAQSSFGCLSRAAMLYALPVSISTAVAASVLPAVTDSSKANNSDKLNSDVSMAIRLVLIISVPCSAGFMAIPQGVLNVLFENSRDYMTLRLIGLSAVFLSVGLVFASILQGVGKIRQSVMSALFAIVTKIVLNFSLMYIWGINGTALSTTLSYFVFMATLLFFTLKATSIRPKVTQHVIKPLFCGLLCFFAALASAPFVPAVAVIAIAAIVYIPSVFLTRLVTLGELNQIFSAHKIEGDSAKNPV
ncbi:MAG: polysaccharide biosynthesis C-terminal domain-containing protein, partial [Clostridia bacterium]|nr:polysaccharide biosynthesis C-terminal domain-containing protein [Clostridia bacterium]